MIVLDASVLIDVLTRDDDQGRAARLLPRMWELRGDLTSCDAAYVALAEAEACPLLTLDARLRDAPGVRCEVRVV
ncbi:hypothetical protein [Nonomuraea sp. NPDC050691]|uniref:hypothetical protein n=1 Tax=Nonomuraea sp. NPDC050691 TaxID=3155661 RepID=UPI0033DF5330